LSILIQASVSEVAAGAAAGLSFPGAGMILQGRGYKRHGLTTAVGIWAVGGVGLAVGAGMCLLETISAALVGSTLASGRVLRSHERPAHWVLKSGMESLTKPSSIDKSGG
jgi:putative Mg2+ transporter-C (MgtC) family protein